MLVDNLNVSSINKVLLFLQQENEKLRNRINELEKKFQELDREDRK